MKKVVIFLSLTSFLCSSLSSASVTTGKCAAEAEKGKKIEEERPDLVVEWYPPQCDAEGNYQKLQHFIGGTFCVDPFTGEIIQGTQRGPGLGVPNCDVTTGKCAAEAEKVKKTKEEHPDWIVERFWARCDAEGNYQKLQSFIGGIFCVDPFTGEIIQGTERDSGLGVPNCDDPQPCEENEIYTECGAKGDLFCGRSMVSSGCGPPGCTCYSPFQRNENTGECVTEDKCPSEQAAPPPRSPMCEENETFVATKCEDSTCEITCYNYRQSGNDNTAFSQCRHFLCPINKPGCTCKKGFVRDKASGKCTKPQDCPPAGQCRNAEVARKLVNEIFNIDVDKEFVPKCDAFGNYVTRQSSGDHFWCVNQLTGKKIDGTDWRTGQKIQDRYC